MAKKIVVQYDHSKIPIVGLVFHNNSGAPASPVNGQVYYDTGTNRFMGRENGTFVLLSQTGAELLANKNAASGYAGLDSGTKVVIAQIPTATSGTSSAVLVPLANDSRLSDARQAVDGSVTGGAAGAGVKLAANTITIDNINAALKDAADATTSLRMLGYTATKAMPGVARLDQIAVPTAAVNANSQEITNLGAPLSASSAARLADVQAAQAGIDAKPSVNAVATAQRALSGTTAIDGVTLTSGVTRVLLTAQTAPAENGPWIANSGAWTRPPNETVTAGAFWLVTEGTVNGGTQWKVSTPDPIVLGTTGLTIVQWGAAGTVYTGTSNRVTVSSGVIDISAAYVGQTSITTLGTITTGTWTGTTIAVANGGTGSTTPAGARTNLGTVGKYTTTYTTAIVAGTPFTITHSLNTQAVLVSIRNTATNEQEDMLVIANAVNTITLTADMAIASPSYEITVIG